MMAPTPVHPHLLAVRQALSALADATTEPARLAAKRQLVTADAALTETVRERHAWLVRNWERLDGYVDTLPAEEFAAKETIYLSKIAEYETWVDVLGGGLLMEQTLAVTETEAQEAMVL